MVRMPATPLPYQDSKQDPELDPEQATATESKTQSGKYEEPRKVRKWVERIETNRDRIVLSVDPEANKKVNRKLRKISEDTIILYNDEKIAKDRDETLMEHGRQFILGFYMLICYILYAILLLYVFL